MMSVPAIISVFHSFKSRTNKRVSHNLNHWFEILVCKSPPPYLRKEDVVLTYYSCNRHVCAYHMCHLVCYWLVTLRMFPAKEFFFKLMSFNSFTLSSIIPVAAA